MNIKKRKLIQQIIPHLEHKNALVITGARQVGKTTLLQYLFAQIPQNQKIWFDLENPLHQKFFELTDYDQIYKALLTYNLDKKKRIFVFLDEIQNFPEITKIIKYLIDHYQIKFLVTGSSSFYMKNLFPESLSGRKFIFNLSPLDFQEFLYFKEIIPDIPIQSSQLDIAAKNIIEYEKYRQEFLEYLEFGGFPEVVLTDDSPTKKMILENIFKSFFERDILQLAHYQDVKEIRDLILLLHRRIGTKLDVTKVAAELGVTRHKLYAYLEFLQATFVIKLISVFSKSIDKKVAAGKKIYFLDTGLVNSIGKIGVGELFENAIANLLTNYGEINYYQDKNKEIDFILNNTIAFEVKIKASVHDLENLTILTKKLGIKNFYLISQAFVENCPQILYPQFL